MSQEVVIYLRPWRNEADDEEYPTMGLYYTLLSYGDYYRYEPINDNSLATRNLMRPLVLGY
jgi:hypothetical protein